MTKRFCYALLTPFLVIYGLSWGYCINKAIYVNSQFKNQLEFAVSDSNLERAAERLEEASDFLKENRLSDRDICFFYYSPLCDTQEFNRKLIETARDLRKAINSDPLTESNMLIRFRETFVTTDKDGERLAFPSGIRGVVTWGSPSIAFLMEDFQYLILFGGLLAFSVWANI
jgi:hypothetical protein